jgi:DNA adenine methylase
MTYPPQITEILEPLLKWPGGKTDELRFILPALPNHIKHYYEPFLGGGAVYLATPQEIPAYVNDKSWDLIHFYQAVANEDTGFFSALSLILADWQKLEYLAEVEGSKIALLENYQAFRIGQLSESKIRGFVDSFVSNHLDEFSQELEKNFPQDMAFYLRTIRQSLLSKMKRMKKIEGQKGEISEADVLDNLEGAMKAAFYTYLRHLYNYAKKFRLSDSSLAAIFFFIRENAYASMFRFNKQGHFNIPYGGIAYNRKNLLAKVERFKNPALLARFRNTVFGNLDFADFIKQYPPQAGDFIFLDPPYDSEFSSYDKNPFGKADQERLAHYLIKDCPANFMMVIKSTEFILSLYQDKGLNIMDFEKKYMYTIKERNNRDVTHLMITNYEERV